MLNPAASRSTFEALLGPRREPVTVTFRDAAPTDVPRVASPAPAGCSYWKLAADGDAFYTVADDHLNCPIGAYTHGVEMPAATHEQLGGMIEKMVGIQYLKMEEVPGIPRRTSPLRFVLYAPLSKTDWTPDVVLLRGDARQMMLIVEAAQARTLLSPSSVMGRPACAVIAATMESGKAATSLGCIGNRVYTGLASDEFYVAVPGKNLGEIAEALQTITSANAELEQFHRGRMALA
ncbi:MAG: DUF169 domain-containing protein [Vicinamibacterales bacterium]